MSVEDGSRDSLVARIKEQGEKVRKLKEQKADAQQVRKNRTTGCPWVVVSYFLSSGRVVASFLFLRRGGWRGGKDSFFVQGLHQIGMHLK